jgi:hypothetical protein
VTLATIRGADQSAEGDKIAGRHDYKAKDCEAKTNDPSDTARLFDHGDKRHHSARFHVCLRQREIALTAPKLFTKKVFWRIIAGQPFTLTLGTNSRRRFAIGLTGFRTGA